MTSVKRGIKTTSTLIIFFYFILIPLGKAEVPMSLEQYRDLADQAHLCHWQESKKDFPINALRLGAHTTILSFLLGAPRLGLVIGGLTGGAALYLRDVFKKCREINDKFKREKKRQEQEVEQAFADNINNQSRRKLRNKLSPEDFSKNRTQSKSNTQ